MGKLNYYEWLRGGCDCGYYSPDIKPTDNCNCDKLILEISKLHTDDLILQDEIDDLSGKVETKLDASAYTPVDLTDYATKQWVEDKGYLTSHQTLKTINGESLIGEGNIVISGGSGATIDAYTKEESDNRFQPKGNYLTEHQPLKTINNQSLVGTGNITISGDTDLTNYYTKQEVNDIVTSAITDVESEIPSLNGYATEQWVLDKHYISGVDLSNYALKSEIPVVPTSNSAFTNDEHYITSADTIFNNYATTGDTYTKQEVDNLIPSYSAGTGIDITNNVISAKIWSGTEAQYQALGTYDNNTLYLVY